MKNIYGLDLRSIALFRVIISIFIACEFLFLVLGNFVAIYSPETGVLGNGYANEYHSFYKGFMGLFFITSDTLMLAFIWLLIGVMILLALGFLPRLMALLGYFLLYLFFNRYSVLYFGWEMYASVMLFWLIFLPSNKYFSLFKTSASDFFSNEYRSPFAFALLFQISIIYFYNGISKNGDLWLSGHAVESFLAETDKVNMLGTWLYSHFSETSILIFFTYLVLAVEIGMPLIIFLPFKNQRFRFLALISILLLHWGIALFADVGNFKFVATAVAALLLPESFWSNNPKLAVFIQKNGNALDLSAKLKSLISAKVQQSFMFFNSNMKFQKVIAILLCILILFANLFQTNASGTNDRMKQFVKFSHLDSALEKINFNLLPQYSFFSQYWHLYSPDPPKEHGCLQIEAITIDNDTIALFNGQKLQNKQFSSHLQKYFFNMLMLKKGRNQKERIAEKYLVLKEIKLWNKNVQNARLRSLQLVIYNKSPKLASVNSTGFNRQIYKAIDVKYK